MSRTPKSEIAFEPDLETKYQQYQRLESRRFRGTSTPSLVLALLGDEMYDKEFKMPKWSGRVTMLQEPKVAVRYNTSIGISTSKSANFQRAAYFLNLRAQLEDELAEVTRYAYETYGDHGPLISGAVRDHFPADIKDRLRFLNHGLTKVTDAARLHEYLSKTRSPLFQ